MKHPRPIQTLALLAASALLTTLLVAGATVDAAETSARRPRPQPKPQPVLQDAEAEDDKEPVRGGRPDPKAPPPGAADDEDDGAADGPAEGDEGELAEDGEDEEIVNPAHVGVTDPTKTRRADTGELIELAFRDVSIEETIDFIMKATGKVVMVKLAAIKLQKITLVSDRAMTKHEALDRLFQAFRFVGVGVIETEDMIVLDSITEIPNIPPTVYIPAAVDIMHRTDEGTFVTKVFEIKSAQADVIGEILQDHITDYATLSVDIDSSQIILNGDIGLAKRIQYLINDLDVKPRVDLTTRTFRLSYTDAQAMADVILELFEANPTGGAARRGGNQRNAQRGAQGRQPAGGGGAVGGDAVTGTSEYLRVSVLPSTNSLIVTAEPEIVDEVERLITEEWDIPYEPDEGKLYRIYDLIHTDPIKVRDVLEALLEAGGGGGGGSRGGARGGGSRGGAGGGDSTSAVEGIFKIEAYPEYNRLIVISKTPMLFEYLDDIIDDLDTPLTAAGPLLIHLKHASAIEVSEQLNAVLSAGGSQATIRAPEEGLSGGGIGESPFGDGGTGGAGGRDAGGGDARGTGGGGDIQFPWQRGRAGDESQAEVSPLVAKSRIVPIVRQNALLVLAPPEIQQHVANIIRDLDEPGRQVMITAIIAEVELNDEFAFGIRVSDSGDILSGPVSDGRISGSVDFTGDRESSSGFFDTSILNVGINANVVLQAIDRKTNVRILQQPRVFTADNKEAVFFDGQDIPFITDSQSGTNQNLIQSFDYRAVGINLNVRPRVTDNLDVNLDINLELSSIVPGVTLFGGAIVDRRETTTQVIIGNGQTIVISGILTEQESEIRRRLPFLGEIPILGDLFGSTEESTQTTELIAFITPIVVENPSDNDNNFNSGERQRLREISLPMEEQSEMPPRLLMPEADSRIDTEAGSDPYGDNTPVGNNDEDA